MAKNKQHRSVTPGIREASSRPVNTPDVGLEAKLHDNARKVQEAMARIPQADRSLLETITLVKLLSFYEDRCNMFAGLIMETVAQLPTQQAQQTTPVPDERIMPVGAVPPEVNVRPELLAQYRAAQNGTHNGTVEHESEEGGNAPTILG